MTTETTRTDARDRVTYRRVGSYWIAWRGRQALAEEMTVRDLKAHLRTMGITDARWAPLQIHIAR